MTVLPGHWRLRLDPTTRRIDGGRVLVGGTPFRLLRFNDVASQLVDQLDAGEQIGCGPGAQALARRLLDVGMANPIPGHGSLTPDDVTVVLPTYPSAEELRLTLPYVGPARTCVVVDDASPDPSVREVAEAHGTRYERHSENRGPSAARNTGWRMADTEIVAFVDPSCLPDQGWIERLLPHFDDPEVGAVAPRITSSVATSLPASIATYERARPSLDRGPVEGSVRPRARVPFVPTAALLVRRADLEAVGGFDEGLRVGEDVDLVWRLVASGRTVRYQPEVRVAHSSRRTTGAWLRQRYVYGTSTSALAARHGAAVAPLTVSPWSASAWAFSALGAPATGISVAGVTTAMLTPKLRSLDHPWREAARLAGLGHLHAGRSIADALRRSWWPLALVTVLVSRRARPAVAAAIVVPPLLEWHHQRPNLDPIRWTGLRLVDDIVYGAGVWVGCARFGSWGALRPNLVDWPGRRPAISPDRP